ncbi:MAG: hypothetical protein ACAH22_06530, partial [Tardiphaga sp.]
MRQLSAVGIEDIACEQIRHSALHDCLRFRPAAMNRQDLQEATEPTPQAGRSRAIGGDVSAGPF